MFFTRNIYFGIVLIALAIISSSEAWVGRAIYHNDDYPGKCYVNANLILLPGQKAKNPEGCSEIRCNDEKGDAMIVGCGSIAPPQNCRWDGSIDVHAPYPLCCLQKYVCDSPEDETGAQQLQDRLRNMFESQLECRAAE